MIKKKYILIFESYKVFKSHTSNQKTFKNSDKCWIMFFKTNQNTNNKRKKITVLKVVINVFTTI